MLFIIRTIVWLSLLVSSSTALAKTETLHGQTADVTLAVDGFTPTLGAGSLGGKYERLVQIQRAEPGKPVLIVSVLVDTPPAGFDPKRLPQHELSSYRS